MSGEESDRPQSQPTIERLRVIRRAHRGVVTKATREIDELLSEEPLSSESVDRLNVLLQQLNNKMHVLQDINREILTLCAVEEIEREIEDSEAVDAKILKYKRKMEEALRSLASSSRSETVETGELAAPLPTGGASQAGKTRLPKLVLPKFRGNVTDWTSFWDAFKAAIHENNEISKVDKLNYLNSLLEGPAALTLQGLSLTEANYDSAVELLKGRYGNPQQIITSHMDQLLKLPTCTGEKASLLRHIYDKLNIHVRGLRTLGINTTQYGSLLIPVVMSKLPNEIRLRVARENKDEVWELSQLMEIIRVEVEAREASESTKVTLSKLTNQPSGGSTDSTASSLVVGNHNIQCVYCKQNHFSASCSSVKNVVDRKSILLKEGRCFVCLKTNHRAQNCDSNKKCRRCGRRHHQSLCEVNNRSPGGGQGAESKKETSTNTTNTMRDKKTILLQTARAVASNEGGSKKVGVRLLLDSGSQRSYLTESLKHKLSLPIIKKEKLYLNTFGSSQFKTQQCEIVRVWLSKPGKEGAIIIDALSFPTICTPLPTVMEISKYPCLADLELADDFSDNSGEIDLLIGSDFYWTIATGEVLRTNGGPTAMSSKLGWLLSGPTEAMHSLITIANMTISQGLHQPQTTSEEDELTQILQNFWQLESLGIQQQSSSEQDEKLFLRNLRYTNTRYEVGLPWVRDPHDLPCHLNMCFNRLKLLQYRLMKDTNV